MQDATQHVVTGNGTNGWTTEKWNGRLLVELRAPVGLTPEQRRKLEAAARLCPVQQSLHPEVEIRTEFLYGE